MLKRSVVMRPKPRWSPHDMPIVRFPSSPPHLGVRRSSSVEGGCGVEDVFIEIQWRFRVYSAFESPRVKEMTASVEKDEAGDGHTLEAEL